MLKMVQQFKFSDQFCNYVCKFNELKCDVGVKLGWIK